MKVGILTFHNTINFGAILQTYALVTKVREHGVDVEIINYVCENIIKNERPISIKNIRNIRGILYFFLTNKYKKRQLNLFEDFQRENLVYSDQVYDASSKGLMQDKYDRIIVGSDQVWNLELSGNDMTYFLDSVRDNKKKHSYAASFGYSKTSKNLETQRVLLNEFSSLAVREESGNKFIKDLTGRNATVVLDPTLLLSKQEWKRITNKRLVPEKYILIYMLDRTRSNLEAIRKYAKQCGYKIVHLHNYLKSECGMVNMRSASPTDFINLIEHAECIFTGSFHAICFSLIFDKKFYYTLAGHGRNSRITDLLDKFHIDQASHLLSNGCFAEEQSIDVELKNEILEKEKAMSLEVLHRIVSYNW